MKFTFNYDDILRISRLSATPGEYDGFPHPRSLQLDWVPRSPISADRIAVAAALSFGAWISDGLFVDIGALSKPTADALRVFLSPKRIELSEVSFRVKEPLRGTSAFLLAQDGGYMPSISWLGFDSPRQLMLCDVPADKRTGASFELDKFLIPSNAKRFTFGKNENEIEYWLPNCAIAVLMAAEFEIGEIWFPSSISNGSKLQNVASLLKSVDIGVRISTAN